MEELDLLTSYYQAIYWDQVSALKIYRREMYVFLFIKTCIAAKLIFHITVNERICA
jgi:hypothetical protein